MGAGHAASTFLSEASFATDKLHNCSALTIIQCPVELQFVQNEALNVIEAFQLDEWALATPKKSNTVLLLWNARYKWKKHNYAGSDCL